MTRKTLLIVLLLLIIHSIVLSIYTLYSGPSVYASQGFDAIWPKLFTLYVAIYLTIKLKAKYWGVSIISLSLAGFPHALIVTIPDYANVLIAITLVMDVISATALFAAYRYDTFDLSILEKGKVTWTSRLLIMVITLIIIVGVFLYYGR
jgi:hypothetical protein